MIAEGGKAITGGAAHLLLQLCVPCYCVPSSKLEVSTACFV